MDTTGEVTSQLSLLIQKGLESWCFLAEKFMEGVTNVQKCMFFNY